MTTGFLNPTGEVIDEPLRTRSKRICGALPFRGAIALFAGLVGIVPAAGGPTTMSGNPGWLGSVSSGYAQSVGANLILPPSFVGANLLVAVVNNDGPDSDTSQTTAIFGGTSKLRWVRHAHISARQDWAAAGDHLDIFGASSVEIFTATPPASWVPAGDVTEISNHPSSGDDGGTISLVAYNNGQLRAITTVDGLGSRPEHQAQVVPSGADIYASIFNGRVNATFTPLPGYHSAVVRRAGDDTAQVISSNSRSLPAGFQTVGYTASPAPGNYWEAAIVVVTPAHGRRLG